ncbi:Crp/Fnr family transcriptional regulator [Limoniibacter endophyticus]|uniref:Crp/Fnr family transcriptional regulator n=1 Tax=Limoniibacter endophyticus TaxID=1565040 RepID=A0A8J3DGU5_9HYPH|nr:Crp/Fnr family transcriptional regulator [Limoniibacter endophyticus]
MHLPRGFVIASAGHDIDYVYFLSSGVASVVTVSANTKRAETGILGRDGFAPTAAGVGGTVSPHDILMQIDGDGFRIPAGALRSAITQYSCFANVLARYLQTLASQIAYTALCNINSQVDVRLARWLLMCHDRLDGDEIPLTHEFISSLLSVRRPSVTTAVHVLEGKRMIRNERGLIIIRDRAGLEEFVGDAYGAPEREFGRLIGPLLGTCYA